MDEQRIAESLRSNFGLRIEPEMSKYVREQLERSRNGQFPVMGGNAFTGVPVRQMIDAARLHESLQGVMIRPIQRVAVVGPSGAGKSTLARTLGPILGLPVIHLDTEHWLPNWTEPPRPQWEARVRELAMRERWIIDGNFGGSQEERFVRADTIVLLDMPNYRCVWRVIKRLIQWHGRVRPDLAQGCYEKWDWEFVEWVWNFNTNDRPKLHERVWRHAAGKNVFHLRDDAQVARFVESMREATRDEFSPERH